VDARWQWSTVKASYSRNSRSASWAAHGMYLARESPERDGGKERGFAAEHEGIDLTATLRGWQRAGDARLWKFIVSPDHTVRLAVEAHTRALVSQNRARPGDAPRLVAIPHHNTNNPHVHLLVRGRDAPAETLQIHPDYLQELPPARAEDWRFLTLGEPGRGTRASFAVDFPAIWPAFC
jgi:type IV secretory pathway VirD2 relaxase